MTGERIKRHLVRKYFEKTRLVCAFSLYPNIEDRKAYEALPKELAEEVIKKGERACEEPWSVILLSDYLEFSKNGNRERFESLYFSRRRKLCSLVVAECAENRGRFLEDILDGIYLILEESSWCLPAHNTHIRDAKQQEYPDAAAPIIDLFAAETGALLAFAEYLLRPVLEKKSPLIREYIDKALKERIFTPYKNEHFWWMGDGIQDMCNWTPWCTQNVLICALTRPIGFFEEKEVLGFLESATDSLDYFLDEYGDDGCCTEGAQYYSHAGLCLFGALYLMQGVCGDEFKGVFQEKLIRNIAAFILRMNVCDNVYINFADCAAICPRRTAREFLFGRFCGDETLCAFAAGDFRKGSLPDKLLFDEINLFYHFIQIFSYKEMEEYKGKERPVGDHFFESTDLMISRDETYLLAVKAGNNADSHNHNDVGSFTVYKNNKPLIIDLGVGTYTRETFSDRRYEIWTMQSQFHNVPTFIKGDAAEAIETLGADSARDFHDDNIVMQKDGIEYAACDVRYDANGERSLLSMDMAGAYKDAGVKSYRRRIGLDGPGGRGLETILEKDIENTETLGHGIEVIDEYEGELQALLTLMVYEKPEITHNDDNELVLKIGSLGEAVVTGVKWAKLQAFPIEDERLKISWKHEVYRVLMLMDEGKSVKMRIR